MNDRERELWVLNDELLYNWWKSTCKGIRRFIRDNRKDLTDYIKGKLNEPMGLKYGRAR